MSVKLFVGGFPLDMDEMRLAQVVAPYGTIEVMKIVRDKRTRVCKGYAFIEMATEVDAANVSGALDGQPIGDRVFSIKLADSPQPAKMITYQKVSRRNEHDRKFRPRRPRIG